MKYTKEYKKHLFADYYLIKPDRLNYAIAERKLKEKNKEEYFNVQGFYTTIRQVSIAIKKLYVREMIMLNLKNETVEQLLNDLDLLNEKINEINKERD
jgi:hypothetical protein